MQKSRKNNHKRTGDPILPYLEEISRVEGFDNVARILCKALQLPDLDTHSGLKRIHANFDVIEGKLEAAFHQYRKRLRIVGGILAIWTRMCSNVLLQTRLFTGGLLPRLMALLNARITRAVVLRAFMHISQNVGETVSQYLISEIPTLLHLALEFPNERISRESVVAILYHVHHRRTPDAEKQGLNRRIWRHLGPHAVLRVLISMLEDWDTSPLAIGHCASLISQIGMSAGAAVLEAFPSLVPIAVVLLRAKDIIIRCNALFMLMSFCDDMDSESDEPPFQPFHPEVLPETVASKGGLPPELKVVMEGYGGPCDTDMALACVMRCRDALKKCVKDHDLCSLGETMADLITTAEHSLDGGTFVYNGQTRGWGVQPDTGLPYTMWLDALPHCAKALCLRGRPEDLDNADICDIKYLLVLGERGIPYLLAIARMAIARNSDVAYFYLAFRFTGDRQEGIRLLKRGLKAKQTTSYVRRHLLYNLIDYAAFCAILSLGSAYEIPQKYAEGIAFAVSALEDAKTFLAESAPDSQYMLNVANWFIILSLLIRGPEVATDFSEINDAIRKVIFICQFNSFLDYVSLKAQNHYYGVLQQIVGNYSKAA